MVTIELLASENSQEIFETLNARGTPLTAADLVRNFVFQQIEREGGNTAVAHQNHWPFESAFCAKEVSVGRYLISRGSLFINQRLVSRTGEEIGPQARFARVQVIRRPQTVARHRPAPRDPAAGQTVWSVDRQHEPEERRAQRHRNGRLPHGGLRCGVAQAAVDLAV
jgi:hypothetical protein